jgi:Holliday junction resolvase
MANRSRDYGLDWERELVRLFKNLDDKTIRTPGSGAFGTNAGISKLQGDVLFSIDGLNFLIEAKAGYGGSKSMTFKRAWMEKSIKEAKNQRPSRIPLLALKLKGGRTESSKLIVMTLEEFYSLMEYVLSLVDKLDEAYEYIFSLKEKGIDVSDFTGR